MNKRFVKQLLKMGVRRTTPAAREAEERKRLLKMSPAERLSLALWSIDEGKKLLKKHLGSDQGHGPA